MEKKTPVAAYLGVVGGNVLWGFSNIFTKLALRYASPLILLSSRFVIAFLLLNVWMLIRGEKLRLKGKNWRPLLILALMEPACLIFESYGILYTNASFAGIVMALAPVFAVLLGVLFLKEFPTKKQLFFCVFPIAGVIIITIAGNTMGIVTVAGVVCLLFYCLTSAGYKTSNKGASVEFSSFERTYVVLGSCAFFFLTFALFSVHGDVSVYGEAFSHLGFVLPMLTLSIICSVVTNLVVNYAISFMSVTKTATFGSVSTLTSAIGGVLFLSEPVSALAVLGAVLIVVGVWMVSRSGQ